MKALRLFCWAIVFQILGFTIYDTWFATGGIICGETAYWMGAFCMFVNFACAGLWILLLDFLKTKWKGNR
jgi:hypothetical protein